MPRSRSACDPRTRRNGNAPPQSNEQLQQAMPLLFFAVFDAGSSFCEHRSKTTIFPCSVKTGTSTLGRGPASEAAGVEFIDENGGGPGIRLRKSGKDKSRKNGFAAPASRKRVYGSCRGHNLARCWAKDGKTVAYRSARMPTGGASC